MGIDVSQTDTAGDSDQTRSQQLVSRGITAGAVLFWAYVLWWAWTQELSRPQYTVLFLGGILLIYLLDEAHDALARRSYRNYADLVVLGASGIVIIGVSAYIFLTFEAFYVERQGFALDHEYQLAWLIVAVILYLTYRSYGKLFFGLVFFSMLYAVYGYYVPGLFYHTGINLEYLLEVLVTDLRGFYGSLTQLTAAWIAPFLLYAGLLFGFGAFEHILRVAVVSARVVKSGVAQTAVITSAVIGSINGSKAANAGMTGSFTIPTMMNAGLSGRTAAGTEGTASTLGQVLPPVMGASAFVMASTLGIAYVDVLVAGLVPAAIMIVCILIAVHYTSVREIGEQDLQFEDYFDERLTRAEAVFEGVRFGVPFLVLILTLGYFQYTVMTAALYTVAAMLVLGIAMPMAKHTYVATVNPAAEPLYATSADTARQDAGLVPVRVVERVIGSHRQSTLAESRFWRLLRTSLLAGGRELKNATSGAREGALILAPIAIILAAISGVVDLLMTTGIPSRISIMIMDLSGGVLLFAVLFGMAVSLFMGVGMPTVAAYVIVSTLVAPTFVEEFGITEMAAHYMVFYASVMAGVTPPVAVSVLVAAGIANANFWRSCLTAISMSAPLFVLPITFIYHPEIVSANFGIDTLRSAVLIALGGVTIVYGLNYPFQSRRIVRIPLRTGLLGLGVFVMVYPEPVLKTAGALAFVLVFFTQRMLSGSHRGSELTSPTEG